jgi:hypothetical protein
VAPGPEVDTENPKKLAVLLQDDLRAPSDKPAVRGVGHPEARDVALADGIEHAPPDSEACVDAIRALRGIGMRGLAGHEILDVAPREVQVVLLWREHEARGLRTTIHLLPPMAK